MTNVVLDSGCGSVVRRRSQSRSSEKDGFKEKRRVIQVHCRSTNLVTQCPEEAQTGTGRMEVSTPGRYDDHVIIKMTVPERRFIDVGNKFVINEDKERREKEKARRPRVRHQKLDRKFALKAEA
jgi:hypothetical protein